MAGGTRISFYQMFPPLMLSWLGLMIGKKTPRMYPVVQNHGKWTLGWILGQRVDIAALHNRGQERTGGIGICDRVWMRFDNNTPQPQPSGSTCYPCDKHPIQFHFHMPGSGREAHWERSDKISVFDHVASQAGEDRCSLEPLRTLEWMRRSIVPRACIWMQLEISLISLATLNYFHHRVSAKPPATNRHAIDATFRIDEPAVTCYQIISEFLSIFTNGDARSANLPGKGAKHIQGLWNRQGRSGHTPTVRP